MQVNHRTGQEYTRTANGLEAQLVIISDRDAVVRDAVDRVLGALPPVCDTYPSGKMFQSTYDLAA